MNVEKAMKTRPARESLDTLAACIRDFQWRREPGGGMDRFADDIPARCAKATSFEEAVWIACESRRANGRMHSHQTKVSVDARREFGYGMIDLHSNATALGWFGVGGFDHFYDDIWDIRPAGIGPLTAYDVATRVGAYLRLAPVNLYLHTGARMGWDAMWGGFRRQVGAVRVPPSVWPVALRTLSADMAEDFLCTYRNALARIARDQHGVPV